MLYLAGKSVHGPATEKPLNLFVVRRAKGMSWSRRVIELYDELMKQSWLNAFDPRTRLDRPEAQTNCKNNETWNMYIIYCTRIIQREYKMEDNVWSAIVSFKITTMTSEDGDIPLIVAIW